MTATPSLPSLSVDEVIQHLAEDHTGEPRAIAFDGDGTLWAGDVGEDVFKFAVGARRIRDEALPALRAAAESHQVDPRGDACALCARLFDAYLGGAFPEPEICELMAWCYAGWSTDSVRELAREALEAAGIERRLTEELRPILDWARRNDVRTLVISASPQIVVEEAARAWRILPKHVIGARPALDGNRIAPRMQAPLPYGEEKRRAGRNTLGETRWIAAFGDNVFDAHMLDAATLGVAVRPKESLCARLPALSNVRVLEI